MTTKSFGRGIMFDMDSCPFPHYEISDPVEQLLLDGKIEFVYGDES
jgi:hypothetical protein